MPVEAIDSSARTYAVEINFQRGYFLAGMPTFGQNLRRARIEAGLKSKELAAIVGATAPEISRWELRGVIPHAEMIAKLAAAVRKADLMPPVKRDPPGHTSTGQHSGPDATDYEGDITRGYKKNDVPIVGWAEAQTNGLIAWNDDGLVRGQIEEWVSRSFADGDPKAYALRIRNDSMVPRYHPGEIIVAQPQVRAKDGDYAVVQFVSEERVVKRIFRRDGRWVLHSENPLYSDREVLDEDIASIHPIRHSIHR